MVAERMHADEIDVGEPLVRRLIAHRFPEWASLPLSPVSSAGTDNAMFRLGAELVVRLPRMAGAVAGLNKELEWMPVLSALLPVSMPSVVASASPGTEYPFPWAVYTWLDGDSLDTTSVDDDERLARDLAGFLDALRAVDLDGPASHRGQSLAVQDDGMRSALLQVRDVIDVGAATTIWDEVLAAPGWSGAPRWIHGDLLPGNVLVAEGGLAGVVDWSAAGKGDPACDLIVAWGCLSSRSRQLLRNELDVDEATWIRGRGWALSIGVIALPYYRVTNTRFARVAERLVSAVLDDGGLS